MTSANPGIKSLLLDINDPDSLRSFSQQVAQDYPELHVLINNAGISKVEDLKLSPDYLADAEAIVTTNQPPWPYSPDSGTPATTAKSAALSYSHGFVWVGFCPERDDPNLQRE